MKKNLLSGLIVLGMAPFAGASMMYGVYQTAGTEHLISFDTASPATLTENVSMSGLVSSDRITDIAFQPSTDTLYGLGSNYLYTVNTTTGVATEVAQLPYLGSTATGFNFDPVTGLIHLAGGNPQTDRTLNPASATSFNSTTALSFASGDTNAGKTPAVVADAFSNNYSGASSTTMYDLNVSNLSATLTTENESTGALSTVGSGIGSYNSLPVGFAISSAGSAYVALAQFSNAGDTNLYSINLATGGLTEIDTIGGYNNYLNVESIAMPVSAVPEPGSLAMVGVAAMAVAARRQRWARN